jgi:DnaJ-class molecular chaperone
MSGKKDLYKMLGLSHDADQREIRTAYRSLAKRYHPDAGEGSSAERFRDVQNAYDILSDVERRRDYDRSNAAASQIPVRRASPYYSRSAHIDLRDFTDPRARVHAEPVGLRFSMRSEFRDMDSWEELLEFLFKGF